MSVVQYKKYFWLVDTIRSAGKITKEQIDRKWSGSRYNDSHETSIPDTSFYRIRRDIEELFDIEILCDRADSTYFYTVKDHLGNICAVVNATADAVVQRTMYYASGVPMAESTGRDL